MFTIPKSGTILAPAPLHLPLYKKITEQYGNIQGIEVITLQAFINLRVPGNFEERVELLYQFKEAMNTLSPNNIFYSSRQDPVFLDACLAFLRQYEAAGLAFEDLPETSRKEIDIKGVLMLFKDIPLREAKFPEIFHQKGVDFSNVYILQKEYSPDEMLWVNYLLKHGASYLEKDPEFKKEYWSGANPRKLAAAIANYILENHCRAEDIFVAVTSQTDKEVLSQIFDQFQIPYTLLSISAPSSIISEWKCILEYMERPTIDTYKHMIDTLYVSEASPVLSFLEEQPDFYPDMNCRLQELEYEENALIDQRSFEQLRKAELETYHWMKDHEYLLHLDLEKAAGLIQNIHPSPSREDLSAFQSCLDLIVQAKSYLHNAEDLGLLIHCIDSISETKTASVYQGILIGKRQEISALRPINFLYNIHANTYPAYQIAGGIFDEAYLAKTKLPTLEERLDLQKNQIEAGLSQASLLIVTYPEADSKGKVFAPSDEIQSLLGVEPVVKNYPDNNVFEIPEFHLSAKSADSLFFDKEQIKMSVSRLETFTSCPLKHFLRYGLALKEKNEWSDIRSHGTMLHKIIENLTLQYGKEYASVSKEGLHSVIEKEYEFGKKIYPHRIAWINAQIEEITYKLALVLEQLNDFESKWHMNIKEREYPYHYIVEGLDKDVVLYGFIDRVDTSDSSFAVFDYKNGARQLKEDHFNAGLSLQLCIYTLAYEKESGLIPVGNFYISLNKITEEQNAVKLAYKKNDNWKTSDENEILEAYTKDRKFEGWIYQKDSPYVTQEVQLKAKSKTKVLDHLTGLSAPTFNIVKERINMIVKNILEDISSGNIQPNFVEQACDWCSYRGICRNARQEAPLKSRLDEEVE